MYTKSPSQIISSHFNVADIVNKRWDKIAQVLETFINTILIQNCNKSQDEIQLLLGKSINKILEQDSLTARYSDELNIYYVDNNILFDISTNEDFNIIPYLKDIFTTPKREYKRECKV